MEIKICVMGLGYVGLPLAVEFSKHYPVIGFDVKGKRIEELKSGKDISGEVSEERLKNSFVTFTFESSAIKETSFVIVCVPTPVDKVNQPDLSFLRSASELVGKNLRKGMIVIYESTVYPGCTEEVCVPILEKFSGLRCGEDFKVGYSPERINPGDKEHTIDKVIKIVGGMDSGVTEIMAEVYGKITSGIHKASSIKVGEAAKVIENIQRDLNIALMNELSIIFDKIGIKTKDVLEAAYTKWNFHRYKPGLVGGHCFEKSSFVFLTESGHQKIKQIGFYIDSLKCKKEVHNNAEIFYPENVKVLSFDMVKNKTLFKPVTIASKRKTYEVLNIKCAYNYCLEVTDLHPVIIYDNGLKVKFAKDVKVGDKLIINKVLPSKKRNFVIDIIEHLDKKKYNRVRIKIKGKRISDFREIINENIKGKKGNYYYWDYLPLEKYLTVEKKLGISRKNIYLCTGRGPCTKKFSCMFKVDKEFTRLIGYYLSEGCITKDGSLRTRFTFHRKEKEYIDDVISILKKCGIDFSIYQDKTYQSTVIKVSSYFLGFLLGDILQCGTNCYNMCIPEIFFDFNKRTKEELLKGLFRGDGGVTWYGGDKTYRKGDKIYTHKRSSVVVNYFTSSEVLFQQVLLFLLNQDIIPRLSKRKGYLSITGYKDVGKVKGWFLGDKKKKINSYFLHKQKKTVYSFTKRYKDYVTIDITGLEKKKTDFVYSIEVSDTHTLITSNGIIAHNCIGVDPYYLTYKSQELGYNPEVILAGRRINDGMYKHLVDKIIRKLNDSGRVLKDSKVAVLGLTFKENVKDFRNSKAKEVVGELKSYGIKVFGCDPVLGKEIVEKEFGVECKELGELNGIDGLIIVSPHKVFEETDWGHFEGKKPFVIDVKSVLDEKKLAGWGFDYSSF